MHFHVIVAVIGVLCCFFASVAEAHPFHFSFAEATWNAESKTLEVALRLESREVEAALRTKQRPKFNLDDESAEKVVDAWLRERLTFAREKDNPIEWKWIGMEVGVKETWAYFEVPLSEGPEGITISNTILFDAIATQVNVMSVADGKQSQRLHFNAKQSKHEVKLKAN